MVSQGTGTQQKNCSQTMYHDLERTYGGGPYKFVSCLREHVKIRYLQIQMKQKSRFVLMW
jgi:hypothetical protein